jgi:GT2 family glycosyltransferase
VVPGSKAVPARPRAIRLMTDITALIPNWNGGARLARVIADLRRQSQPPARILVVDNGSSDGSETAARGAGCDLIAMGRNAGFAAAVNTGIRDCRSEFVAIVNNDVELDPPWLERLAAALSTQEIWFAAGKLRSLARPGVLDGAFDLVSLARTAWRCGSGKADATVWDRPAAIHSAPMTATLFRKALFDRIGPLDERFESYLEDVDFGIRCALASCRGVYVPEAGAGHWGSATLGAWSTETVRLIARNQIYLVWKYRPERWLSRTGWSIVAGQGLWALVVWKNAGLGGLAAWLSGKRQGMSARGVFPQFRHSAKPDRLFDAQQAEIRELQKVTGPDTYWRLYFLLAEGRPL